MPLAINCPECQATLRVQEEFAGKKVRCPKCGASITAGDELAEVLPVESVTERRPPKSVAKRPATAEEEEPCPECDELIPVGARRCRYCKAQLDDDDDDEEREQRPRRRRKWVKCPRCGASGAERVTWTFWGSFYGPALFNHVRCPGCGYAYNGKTGGSNLIVAIIFVTIPALLLLGLLGFITYVILHGLGRH